MGERTSHPPGTFSWAELATTDPGAAKAFYGRLFGWDAEDVPAGDSATYTMLRRGDRSVAGMFEQTTEQRDQGVPPFWLSYVTVDDADATATRASELGGAVIAGPFDVLDSGRMAIINDPQGAPFAIWEPREHPGAQLVNEHGALTWNDLTTPDPDAAGRFYGELFGWDVARVTPDQPYWMVAVDGRDNGGIMEQPAQLRQAGVPPAWMPYFAVDDLDAGVRTATEAGGSVVVGPMDVPAGRFVALRDPQGAVFSLFAGRFDD